MGLSDYLQHRRDCQFKQNERAERIRSLPPVYHAPFTPLDRSILTRPIGELVSDVHSNVLSPVDILRAYGKAAIKAHAKTNCLTEVMISSAEESLPSLSPQDLQNKPLAGIPVSLKDSIVVGGYDTTVGYSSFVGNKNHPAFSADGPMVRLLKDAGAVPYVKTNLPITLLSFESTNDVWGRCTNPHNKLFSPGGSTGGESALLAAGGSRIGVGSDVAGSVRVPAHFSGCYSLRCSTGRWPKLGIATSMPGQEGVPAVYSPMARTLDDLRYFTRSVIGMGPWRYDYTVHPGLEWRGEVEKEFAGEVEIGEGEKKKRRKLKVGVMWTDGVVDPAPACVRALRMVETALRKDGHEVVDVVGQPDTYEALRLASLLLNADGCQMFDSFRRTGEWTDPGAKQMRRLASLPGLFRWVYYLWVKYVKRDDVWAGLVKNWRAQSAYENWHLVKAREAYRWKWFEWWEKQDGLDVIITPPNATPAVPHDGMWDAVASCGYTFLFNLIDYTAGVLPVTHVDKTLDKLPATFSMKKLNGVAKGAYKHYDAERMHGLPVGVQVVGRRLEEEKVLGVMQAIEDALGEDNSHTHHFTQAYQTAASFVPKLATKVMQWLDPQKDDVILDIGCGDGVLDLQIAEILAQGSGSLHGIDSSKAMIEAAKLKCANTGEKCTFEVLDATELINHFTGQKKFTKVFSNAAMHWILRPESKRSVFFQGVKNVLLPGGIFAFEMGGLGNVSELRTAIHMAIGRRVGLARVREIDPWFFPDENWVKQIMEEQVGGWQVEKIERQWRPTDADEAGVEGWIRLMAADFFQDFEDKEKEKEECIREICDVLEEICKKPGKDGQRAGYMFSYVRLRVLARRI
ncbi:amidase [Naviculisporaceae sp. PSN 640]